MHTAARRTLLGALAAVCFASCALASEPLPDRVPVPPVRAEGTPAPGPVPVQKANTPPDPAIPSVARGANVPRASEEKQSDALWPEELVCRDALRTLGAQFKELPRLDEPAGCVVGHPIALTRLTKAVAITPDTVVDCEIALAAARFTANILTPMAQREFGRDLVSLGHGSGYVCRSRAGTQKLSEHAYGNALDIGSFELAGGEAIVVGAAADPRHAAFVDAVRKAACGPFRTVLGPGSDASHATHLHLDLAPRKNDATFCQ